MRKSAKAMEELLKRELGTSKLVPFGAGGGGCISSGTGYNTDDDGQIFVKVNNKDGVSKTFKNLNRKIMAQNSYVYKCNAKKRTYPLRSFTFGGTCLVKYVLFSFRALIKGQNDV